MERNYNIILSQLVSCKIIDCRIQLLSIRKVNVPKLIHLYMVTAHRTLVDLYAIVNAVAKDHKNNILSSFTKFRKLHKGGCFSFDSISYKIPRKLLYSGSTHREVTFISPLVL